MNKQVSAAFLIIVSIFVLALKDSASLIHTVLHYIPNNSWHQHGELSDHKHHINPLEIHKYLQNKHTHGHSHAHDVMDHIHHDAHEDKTDSPSEEIKHTIKIDCYFQSLSDFHLLTYSTNTNTNHFSIYIAFIRYRGVYPPYQPPQV